MNLEQLKEKALLINELYGKYDEVNGKEKSSIQSLVMQFVSDVGDLSRYITKHERGDKEEDFKENISRELAECLSHILLLSERYNINLEESFLKEFNRLNSQLSK